MLLEVERGWVEPAGHRGLRISLHRPPARRADARLGIKDDKLVLTNEGDQEIQFRGWVANLDDGK